ncbi:Chaperone protein DnaK [compost metagenome]
MIVGEEAYNQRYKPNAIYSVKKLMGSGKKVTLRHAGRELVKTPAEISSEILKALVEKASKLYKDIKDVVITVPAEFNNKQIEDTKIAAELAGLNLLNIMREPTAASLVYRLDKKDCNVIVYDLGGGTFDVSMVSIKVATNMDNDILSSLGLESNSSEKDSITVRATRGDTALGGDDLDHYMYDLVEERIKDLGYNTKLITEQDKEKITLRLEHNKKIDFSMIKLKIDITLKDGTRVLEDIPFTKDDYKKCTRKLFNRTRKYTDDLIKSEKVKLDGLVLVGGSTKNAYLQEMLREAYPGLKIYNHLNPDESVALGASINAKRLKYGSEDLEIFDVTSGAIGVLADGRITHLIEKNQSIPYTTSKIFATSMDDQELINVEVYEGSGIYAQDNIYLGNLILRNIPKGKAGTIRVVVELSIDDSGLLECQVITESNKIKTPLVNILGKTEEKKESKTSIKHVRWFNFAETLDNDKKLKLTKLIKTAIKDPSKDKDVVTYIRSVTENA